MRNPGLLSILTAAGAMFVLSAANPAATLAQPAPQASAPAQPIAYVETQGVSLAGPLSVANGRAAIGNNSTVTAGDKTATVKLVRGGSLKVCASTSLHLSKDVAPVSSRPSEPDDAGLMLALDRGAVEASYTTGKYSDVLLTPDLRILISGPGVADVRLRVNLQGDTCVDNRGDHAPYVTVSSLMDGGVYRVQPGQRVLFEHGSLGQVDDSESESCGCPEDTPAVAPAAVAGKPVGGPSSTPADTAFPTAVSEGLAAPPASPTTPVVPAGQAHAQVTASLSSDTPPGPPPAQPAQAQPETAPVPAQPPATPPAQPAPRRGIFHSIGHFFTRVFGGES
jgi:hypothetical protein